MLKLYNCKKFKRSSADPSPIITAREQEFLELCCTEPTYKEIANKMNVSPRPMGNYREDLLVKLNIRSGTSVALYVIKNCLVSIDDLK